ncbi:Gfo/Idh/MocA family oxidoreductase [Bradyrhizobium sp. 174]|uniref:Gfo/Idh/MocA family protein n=1 Tax=Bradyrhizobium sp. 174 TaxID=2782645 RepID=UPI001FF950F5|nr:Gfo/Idh/MocA family oxidoreductase [Bradyrhizobium sp. 174]MCK1571208.1 Gfo/Idh/MocA family oxidoreductase [Bradyrhizobium sp. 174]
MNRRSGNKLTATVIGAGHGGSNTINALLASDRYELIGVADMSEAARARVNDKTGGAVKTYAAADELLKASPADVVCIATFPGTHLPLTRDAVATGYVRGLLIEKPLGETTASGHQILGLVKAAKLPMVVPHWLMACSASLQVLSDVRNGRIGNLRVVEIECTNWDMHSTGPHLIQYFLALVSPSNVQEVLMAADVSTRTFRTEMQVETEAVTFARTTNGVRLIVNTGDDISMSRKGACIFMRITGQNGFIEFDTFKDSYTVVASGQDRVEVSVEPFATKPNQRHLEHLADQIESGERDYLIPDQSLSALEVVEAAYQSRRYSKLVSLPLTPETLSSPPKWDPGAPYDGKAGGRDGRQFLGRYLEQT